ncbi:MAG: asparagine--tRNA ligase [Desulfobacterales bacterium]|nr:asparagine--tRNA ligase [Desulfobacterales bacterium]
MNNTKIKTLLESLNPINDVIVKGWIKTTRNSKTFSFIEVNDGTSPKNLQVIVDSCIENYEDVKKLTTGSSVSIKGKLVQSKGKGQNWELISESIEIINFAPAEYPLQKKQHTDEFLRTIAHIRPRSTKYGSIFRIRSELSYLIHKFFKERGFYYLHSPIITCSDCEGAGELFKITSFDLNDLPIVDGKIDYSSDFFGKQSYLTVSGQLSAEIFAMALNKVYTFGPTFRAENSNTPKHLAEFWMIEPEMAFCDLNDNMSLAEEFLKYLAINIMNECSDDLDCLSKHIDSNMNDFIKNIFLSNFVRVEYKDAVKILNASKRKFEFEINFGKDLQTEHERFLTEEYFKAGVIVYNYPKSIKPFYMRLNEDNETVAAMDVLLPRVGEIIGGSQREERLDLLEKRMDECGLKKENYWWYLDLRKYGSVPHSGFGMGFERILMTLTGVSNIRDVMPFPRTPKNLEF